MQKIKSILTGIAVCGFLGLGLVQLSAIYSFFSDYWGWWSIISGPAALFVAFIPVVGAIFGTVAAYNVWDWNLLGSILLFFWPYALYIPATMIDGARDVIRSIEDKKKAS